MKTKPAFDWHIFVQALFPMSERICVSEMVTNPSTISYILRKTTTTPLTTYLSGQRAIPEWIDMVWHNICMGLMKLPMLFCV